MKLLIFSHYCFTGLQITHYESKIPQPYHNSGLHIGGMRVIDPLFFLMNVSYGPCSLQDRQFHLTNKEILVRTNKHSHSFIDGHYKNYINISDNRPMNEIK